MNHTCCFAPTSYNNPVVEAPCSWVVNNQTVNLGYSANSYNDASEFCRRIVLTASLQSADHDCAD